MGTGKKRSSKRVDDLLEEMLVDAYGDSEQLGALADHIADALDFPVDVHVVGEPLSLVAVDYDGNQRRGIVGRCRSGDGTEYRLSLADIELERTAAGYLHVAAYYKWLGVEPAAPSPGGASTTNSRIKTTNDDEIDVSRPVDLILLSVKQRDARCRLPSSSQTITFRTGSQHQLVPGQIATIEPRKHWRYNGHPYLSGEITSLRTDAPALGLPPLRLHELGDWDPAQEYWGEEGEPVDDWAKPLIKRGPRPMFEMEQVLPGSDPDDFDSHPILDALDRKATGDTAGALDIFAGMLESDLRCLDAHAHLGSMQFHTSVDWALSHYEVGVRIGELSLGDDFDGVLAWSLIDNRPFLRCMRGYGLCLWRLERWDEAERVFERMLWMNPSDNPGIRFLLPDVRAREPWVDDNE